jgi:hypothetical protein
VTVLWAEQSASASGSVAGGSTGKVKKGENEAGKVKPGGDDEDEINSDLDDPDEDLDADEDEAGAEQGDFVIALYEKVRRASQESRGRDAY